ncbi:hypothetical protein ABZU32_25510 [Sphaerisporangium sp. NPDC005288]|uniref:Uncharacterized protein n=1 Tax=Sphaerisporangium rhizosphaerae TaxID=2269375 RepID=A0ABW2P209_9ACTN
MADARGTRGHTPALSLLALIGALAGVVFAAKAGPVEAVELRLDISHSTGASGPVTAP